MRWEKRWLKMHPECDSLWQLLARQPMDPRIPELHQPSDVHLRINRRAAHGPVQLVIDLAQYKQWQAHSRTLPPESSTPEGDLAIVGGRILVTGVDL